MRHKTVKPPVAFTDKPSPESPKLKSSSNQNPSPKSMAGGKNSETKSNDANRSSEGGEDIFTGCRKESAGEAAEAEMGDGERSPNQKCSMSTQKCSTSTPKIIYLRPDKFICVQINPPCGGYYLRANKNLQIHR
jgi:hypothetical protein